MSTATSEYDPPAGLTDVEAVSACKTDVSIKLREPFVTGASLNETTGTKWEGVTGVTVRLAGGKTSLSAVTDASGRVQFKDVPCGTYRVTLSQTEFKVENLGQRSLDVASGKKSGNDFDLKIRRQLMTVEMFRLPTLYLTSIQGGMGKRVEADQDPYGHHWVKVYTSEAMAQRERPRESYGWWPIEGASADKLWSGVKGSLNGYPVHSRIANQDPYHTHYLRGDKKLEETFFPYVTNGKTADQYKADLVAKSHAYAGVSGGIWSWRGNGAGFHCKTFQTYLMREVRLWKRVGVGVGSFGWSTGT